MILKLSPTNPSFVASHGFYLPGHQSYEDTISYCPNRPTPFTVTGGRELRKLILTSPSLHIIELHAPYHRVFYFEYLPFISFLNDQPTAEHNLSTRVSRVSHGNENTDLCAYKQALIGHFQVRNNNKMCIIYGLMFSSLLLTYPSLFQFGLNQTVSSRFFCQRVMLHLIFYKSKFCKIEIHINMFLIILFYLNNNHM